MEQFEKCQTALEFHPIQWNYFLQCSERNGHRTDELGMYFTICNTVILIQQEQAWTRKGEAKYFHPVKENL